jgi:hypothetical protein
MNRLQAELQRLYLPADGQVTGVVLELVRPAGWEALARVWRGVQEDLDLPAPAIAISGVDGYQLWFSFAQALPAAQALAFAESLRARYLGDIPRDRVRAQLAADAVAPSVERSPGQWSAFVAPDLAAVFDDEPWLDLPPGVDAQAEVLARLDRTRPDDLQRALAQLGPVAAAVALVRAEPPSAAGEGADPRRFLLGVMNDASVALSLRIEAAKALLPFSEGRGPR